ncbi:MAG: hypothetical protein LBV67_12005 [Streptococcaceae bacterium]|jgi:hypothetical protein|nr:hypothetical protein [Streptococcaceae bacterium]
MSKYTDIFEFFFRCYRAPQRLRDLWDNKNEFSKILMLALSFSNEKNNGKDLKKYADYFINFTSVFLIQQKDDLLTCLREIKKPAIRVSFMNRFFDNYLVSNEIIFDFLNDENLIKAIDDYEEWIEAPLLLRTRIIIGAAKDKSLDVTDIIPLPHLDFSNYLKEYILGWAYEEKKLSIDGENYFKANFSKKYDLLFSLRTRNNK